MPSPPPDALRPTVTGTWGAAGVAWLASPEVLLGGLAAELGLELGPARAQSFHAVRAVTRADGTPAVLKAGVPDGHRAVLVRAAGGPAARRPAPPQRAGRDAGAEDGPTDGTALEVALKLERGL